jgi:predicted nucleic acid-binding protein
MSAKVFLDTNVIVYAYDQSEPVKQRAAQAILTEALRTGSATVSSQVLSEFFVTATRKIRPPLTPVDALGVVRAVGSLQVVTSDLALVESAIDIHQRHTISYWDAMIIAAAVRGGCTEVYSEDLNHAQDYDGVVVQNPFRTP